MAEPMMGTATVAPDATVIHVATAAPYDVLVGEGLLGRLPALLGERAERVGLVFPGDRPDLAEPVRDRAGRALRGARPAAAAR